MFLVHARLKPNIENFYLAELYPKCVDIRFNLRLSFPELTTKQVVQFVFCLLCPFKILNKDDSVSYFIRIVIKTAYVNKILVLGLRVVRSVLQI